MISDRFLEIARAILDVTSNSDGEEIRISYCEKVDSLLQAKDHLSCNDLFLRVNELNTSIQLLVNHGIKHMKHDQLFTLVYDSASGKMDVANHPTSPYFSYNCWNPVETEFSTFEFGFLNEVPRAIRYEKMKRFYLPYQCLCRLIDTEELQKGTSLIDYNYFASIPHPINTRIEVPLVRTSYNRRSNNIDQMKIGDTLSWRITAENKRYPYSIELLSSEGLSLGEIPNCFSACITPLSERRILDVSFIVTAIDRRCDRGRYARCSYMSVLLTMQSISDIPIETYFGITNSI